jgi:hypothetical protein
MDRKTSFSKIIPQNLVILKKYFNFAVYINSKILCKNKKNNIIE